MQANCKLLMTHQTVNTQADTSDWHSHYGSMKGRATFCVIGCDVHTDIRFLNSLMVCSDAFLFFTVSTCISSMERVQENSIIFMKQVLMETKDVLLFTERSCPGHICTCVAKVLFKRSHKRFQKLAWLWTYLVLNIGWFWCKPKEPSETNNTVYNTIKQGTQTRH